MCQSGFGRIGKRADAGLQVGVQLTLSFFLCYWPSVFCVQPENILLRDDTFLKVADYGSCRGIYTQAPYTEYISTRWYRAPEWSASSPPPPFLPLSPSPPSVAAHYLLRHAAPLAAR